MKRLRSEPRKDWQPTVERQGLVYHTPDGQPYWDESVCYRFSAREVDEIEAATAELQRMCLEAGQFIVDNNRFEEFRIPPAAQPAIVRAWNEEPPSIYGRFDLSYDGGRPPKLLEYNANTPTGLLEAAVIQWQWLEDTHASADQFNSIHEKLISQWTDIKPFLKGPLHFTSMRNEEDAMTAGYLRDTAGQAGLEASHLFVEEIGWNGSAGEFRDLADRRIESIFALYPWEWLLKDFGPALLAASSQVVWIEPIWKMMWSNKALLALLWEMYPSHPNLLEAHLDGPAAMRDYVKKPLLSREGANVTIRRAGREISTEGTYGAEGYVWQALAPDAVFDGNRPVLGSWIVTDRGPSGMGIRESAGPVTDNLSRFVPHYFD